jgi:hypothetical protein
MISSMLISDTLIKSVIPAGDDMISSMLISDTHKIRHLFFNNFGVCPTSPSKTSSPSNMRSWWDVGIATIFAREVRSPSPRPHAGPLAVAPMAHISHGPHIHPVCLRSSEHSATADVPPRHAPHPRPPPSAAPRSTHLPSSCRSARRFSRRPSSSGNSAR